MIEWTLSWLIPYKEEKKDEAALSRQIDLFGEPQTVCEFFYRMCWRTDLKRNNI